MFCLGMKSTPSLAVAIIGMSALSLASEVDVYLLAGQSNMQGLGQTNELTAEQKAPPKDLLYWNGKAFEPLIPGVTVTAGKNEFGPEIGFAAEISKNGRKACIIKDYNSGKPLDAGWNDQKWIGDPPAPNRITFYPGTAADDPNQGTLYKNGMLPRFKAGLAAITIAGDIPHIRALVWMQGEADSKNPVSAARYAADLKNLRDRIASDLGLATPTTLPLVFGQVLPYEPALPRFICREVLRAQQAAADMKSGKPEAIPFCRMVSTDGYPLRPDTVHYTTAGQFSLGKAFATAVDEFSAKPAK